MCFNTKHPIILPKYSQFTKLVIGYSHAATLHGGCQQTMSHIRKTYWIVNCCTLVRSYIHKCITCLTQNPTVQVQMMADLPRPRVTAAQPFQHCGIDYAGPVSIKAARGRGYVSHKAYVAVFVCFCTKTVHLEAVTDLTSQGFLAAFERFRSRRGTPSHIYSDRGTNFIGAAKELKQLFKNSTKSDETIAEQLAIQGIQWHFNPPSSPHQGGIWEAALKSFKHHFRRVVNDKILTFEELSTLLTQIETCFNSRPLYPMSNDPKDLQFLSPAHFLIGNTLNSIPEPIYLQDKLNYLDRWKLVQQMKQQFWKQRQQNYLISLQQRYKWATSSKNIKVNDMVLVKDERTSPTKWIIGRIDKVHSGPDGVVRVVTIHTKNGMVTRPIVKICPLELKD